MDLRTLYILVSQEYSQPVAIQCFAGKEITTFVTALLWRSGKHNKLITAVSLADTELVDQLYLAVGCIAGLDHTELYSTSESLAAVMCAALCVCSECSTHNPLHNCLK